MFTSRSIGNCSGRSRSKILLDSFSTDTGHTNQFSRQAKIMASLSHPNIVSVFDVGDSPERHFVAMEYLSGGTLSALLRRQPVLDPSETARLGTEIAAALHYADGRQIAHRDLKPGNVLLSFDLHARVSGFGMARPEDEGDPLTIPGFRLGASTYFSPEHVRGSSITALSDIYSLGVILYEMATGRPPFVGSPLSVAYKHVYEELIPPGEMNRAVPAPLDAIIRQCLEKDPAGRYESAAAVSVDLDRFLSGETVPSMSRFSSARSAHGAVELNQAPQVRAEVPSPSKSISPRPSAPAMTAKPGGAVVPASPQPRRRHIALALGGLLLLGGIGVYAVRSVSSFGSTHHRTIPNLAGMSEARAAARIRTLGLRIVTRTRPAALSESGLVVAQLPVANQVINDGTTVTVIVGVPRSLKVPLVANLSQATAQALLVREGFRPTVEYVPPTGPSQRDGLVLAQHPASGRVTPAGSTVLLEVVKVTTVGVPDVAGLTLSEAAVLLHQSGLEVAMKFVNATSSTVANGLVIGSRPKSTARLPKGAAVVLVVSTGTPITSTTATTAVISVPTVIGEPVQRAARAVKSRGLSYRVVYEVTDQAALDGTVAKTTPRGGSAVSPGSVLMMTIWSYTPPTTTLAGVAALGAPVQSSASP